MALELRDAGATEETVERSSRKRADNPFLPLVQESWNSRGADNVGKTMGATVGKGEGKRAMQLVRSAAASENIGISVQVKDVKNGERVVFAAKPKRAYSTS
jgi:hypothetical protein